MRPAEFLRQIARTPPGPAYLFSGPELFLKQRALDALIALVPEGVRDFGLNIYDAGEADPAEVVAAARTIPFLAPRRIVVLRDLERLRGGEKRAAPIEEYLRAPALETTLVATTASQECARAWGRRCGEWLQTVEFAALRGRELEAQLRDEAARLGCRIEAAAVATLLEAAGQDLWRLRQELEKLRSAVGEGGTVGVGEVERLAAAYSYQTHFEFVQAVADRDLRRSLRLLSRVATRPEDFIPIIGLLAKRLRTLWFLAGDPRGELPPAYRATDWQLRQYRTQAARFSRPEIEGALARLLEIDRTLKSGALPPRVLFEMFLLGFLAPARPAAGSRGGAAGAAS